MEYFTPHMDAGWRIIKTVELQQITYLKSLL
jgi:hypothetical protein